MSTKSELEYLYSLTRFGIKPGLAVMEQMIEALGHPEKQFKSIHVTGTNGKGSTCAMMESILRTAGKKTALYTSPHLYAFNERIRVNGINIPDKDLVSLVAEIRAQVERENIQPTFFEFTTALAYLYFARSNIDIAIIEVGMGGRFDATNVITPILSIITNVGLDHMEYMGPTTADIGKEKAGIIKEGVPVLTAEKDKNILALFDEEAKEKHTSVVRVDDVVRASIVSSDLKGQEVEVFTPPSLPLKRGGAALSPPCQAGVGGGGSVGSLKIHLPLLGAHQVENMKTAIGAVTTLAALHSSTLPTLAGSLRVNPNALNIREGIANTIWEGRMQVVSHKPLMIFDGAHNEDGSRALLAFLQTIERKDTIVFAVKKGKDISYIIQNVIPLFALVIVTEGAYMPELADMLAEKIRNIHSCVLVERDVALAITKAKTMTSKDGTIIVTGSLYMIADALTFFKTL